MRKISLISILCGLVPGILLFSGCSDKFWDPTQVGRFRPVPAVNVILDSLGVAEETPSRFEDVEDPKPVDIMPVETDYRFSPGDIVRISIFELLQQGMSFIDDYVVTETGKISISDVGIVQAEGLTEAQLEDEIKGILTPAILKKPAVSAILMSSQKRTFSISGNGVPAPSRYNIPRTDFRLLDALAVSGGVSQFNISYIYVTRNEDESALSLEGFDGSQGDENMGDLRVPDNEMLELITPYSRRSDSGLVITSAELALDSELEAAALPEGFEMPEKELDGEVKLLQDSVVEEQVSVATISEPFVQQQKQIEWVFENGKWVPVEKGGSVVEAEAFLMPVQKDEAFSNLDFDELTSSQLKTRVIQIPADRLAGGDPKYNIIIRPGDSIQVPVDIIGEFYIMGNVTSQGYIDLTGRPMTLKMAIASAGGLGPLAWPKKCEVIRRIGKNREEIVMVDLEKISNGETPDFFIKPNDLINVGTHPTSRWRAVIRNAFRATYGFGFIYDRNFADRDYGTSRPFSLF
jgi:polysaccharide export outer membrane protein